MYEYGPSGRKEIIRKQKLQNNKYQERKNNRLHKGAEQQKRDNKNLKCNTRKNSFIRPTKHKFFDKFTILAFVEFAPVLSFNFEKRKKFN